MVLTHQHASDMEKEPYLANLWHPVPVHCLYGRSATAEPVCRPDAVVFHNWKDTLFVSYLSMAL